MTDDDLKVMTSEESIARAKAQEKKDTEDAYMEEYTYLDELEELANQHDNGELDNDIFIRFMFHVTRMTLNEMEELRDEINDLKKIDQKK